MDKLNLALNQPGPASSVGALALVLAALVIFFLLIIIFETAALQLMSWGSFRRCLRGSIIMNLASVVAFVVLWLVPVLGLLGLLVAWALSVLIEGWVLWRMQPETGRRSWLLAMIANLASYLILVFPTYLSSQR